MTTDQVGESRDVGALLHGERQVLEITSGDHGTTVRARLPLAKDAC